MCNFDNTNTLVVQIHDFLLWSDVVSAEEWKKRSDVDFIEALQVYADEVEFLPGRVEVKSTRIRF